MENHQVLFVAHRLDNGATAIISRPDGHLIWKLGNSLYPRKVVTVHGFVVMDIQVPKSIRAAEKNLRLVLIYTEGMFRHRKTLNPSAYASCLQIGKNILEKCKDDLFCRLHLGSCSEVWSQYTACFAKAMPEIQRQSFLNTEPNMQSIGSAGRSNADVMIKNYATLTEDLERLNDLMVIARNIVATFEHTQNLAHTAQFDQQVFQWVKLCVCITARGYDGDLNANVEAQWTIVLGHFKTLLITCLQFLHNLIRRNERRKMVLWIELFGDLRFHDDDPFTQKIIEGATEKRIAKLHRKWPNTEVVVNDVVHSPLSAYHATEEMSNVVAALYKAKVIDDTRFDKVVGKATSSQAAISPLERLEPENVEIKWANIPLVTQLEQSDKIRDADMMMIKSPESAAETLIAAKEQLLARLQTTLSQPQPGLGTESFTDENPSGYIHAQGSIIDDEALASDTNADAGDLEDEEDDDEDDGPSVGDQERGLLTDIPLVLGLNEVDALAMIIQQGIVNAMVGDTKPDYPKLEPEIQAEKPQDQKRQAQKVHEKKMQAVRCHILLAQDTGRNLLRELLIFIAAWDLPDDAVYFRLMMQIMDAILENGLMPYAYETFGEAKDIVSPAQSIIIKLLTQVFRKRQGLPPMGEALMSSEPAILVDPTRAEVLIVQYLFTAFRQSIIPETCALIYLQGQIKLGVALLEDFPLNLWDMERVYEGIYQFLEFFAVLTEHPTWKELLVKWEIVSELVTLLRELDLSIPKAPLAPAPQAASSSHIEVSTTTPSPPNPTPASVSVERPYDPIASDDPAPTAYDADDSSPASPDQEPNDPPAAKFEWRNLKKLVVLVLSSLVWKAPAVQAQIRQYGGVEIVLNCCNLDEHNPFIREHAIMCLRFLLEDCLENQAILEQLEARAAVPNEVLDKHGYETFLDEEGKVGLRRRMPVAEGENSRSE